MQNIIHLWFVPIEGRGSLTPIKFLDSLTFIKLLGIAIILSSGDDRNSLLLLWEI